MTFDPTTNRIPFVLLTWEEQETLKAWPHKWEYFCRWSNKWILCVSPEWTTVAVYRGKPAPVVTSTWRNIYAKTISVEHCLSRAQADTNALYTRIAVLRTDTCNGVSTAHLEDV